MITQERYALEILQRVGMLNCKPADTSLPTGEKLVLASSSKLGPEDSTRYQSIVGALQYLTLNDLTFLSL